MIPRMRIPRAIPLAATLAILTPVHSIRAQSASGAVDAPAAVADSFFRAWGEAQWNAAARLMDLETFGKLRAEEVRSMRRTRTRRMTADELMKEVPKMPRAVAEYQAADYNEQAGRSDRLLYAYANVPSVDSLAALSVEDAAARWLEAKDQRYTMRRALEEQRARCNVPDSVFAQIFPLPTTKYEVLGTIVKDSLAWSLFEQTFDMSQPDSLHSPRATRSRRSGASWTMPPSVLTLRRIGDVWRVAPGMPFGNPSSFMVANCTRVTKQTPPPHSP